MKRCVYQAKQGPATVGLCTLFVLRTGAAAAGSPTGSPAAAAAAAAAALFAAACAAASAAVSRSSSAIFSRS